MPRPNGASTNARYVDADMSATREYMANEATPVLTHLIECLARDQPSDVAVYAAEVLKLGKSFEADGMGPPQNFSRYFTERVSPVLEPLIRWLAANQPTSARTFSVAYFRDPAKIAQAKAELAEARKGPWPEPPSPRSAAAASAAAPKKRGGAGGAARGRSPTRRSESKRSEGKRGESKRAEAKSRGASRGAGRSSSRGASAEGSARSGSRGRARTGRPISRGAMEARNRLLPAHSEMRRRGTSAVDDPAFERDPTRPLSRGAYETRNKLLPAYSQEIDGSTAKAPPKQAKPGGKLPVCNVDELPEAMFIGLNLDGFYVYLNLVAPAGLASVTATVHDPKTCSGAFLSFSRTAPSLVECVKKHQGNFARHLGEVLKLEVVNGMFDLSLK